MFERTDDNGVEPDIDDGGGGARFSFCNSFKWDRPLIIVELNSVDVDWIEGFLVDDRWLSSAISHKLIFAKVEQSLWRSSFKKKRRNMNEEIRSRFTDE